MIAPYMFNMDDRVRVTRYGGNVQDRVGIVRELFDDEVPYGVVLDGDEHLANPVSWFHGPDLELIAPPVGEKGAVMDARELLDAYAGEPAFDPVHVSREDFAPAVFAALRSVLDECDRIEVHGDPLALSIVTRVRSVATWELNRV